MEGPLPDGLYPCNGIPRNIHAMLAGNPAEGCVTFCANKHGLTVTMTVGQILKTEYKDLVEQVNVGLALQDQADG